MKKLAKKLLRKHIHISLDPQIWALAQDDATARGLSLSKRIELLLRQALEENAAPVEKTVRRVG